MRPASGQTTCMGPPLPLPGALGPAEHLGQERPQGDTFGDLVVEAPVGGDQIVVGPQGGAEAGGGGFLAPGRVVGHGHRPGAESGPAGRRRRRPRGPWSGRSTAGVLVVGGRATATDLVIRHDAPPVGRRAAPSVTAAARRLRAMTIVLVHGVPETAAVWDPLRAVLDRDRRRGPVAPRFRRAGARGIRSHQGGVRRLAGGRAGDGSGPTTTSTWWATTGAGVSSSG